MSVLKSLRILPRYFILNTSEYGRDVRWLSMPIVLILYDQLFICWLGVTGKLWRPASLLVSGVRGSTSGVRRSYFFLGHPTTMLSVQ